MEFDRNRSGLRRRKEIYLFEYGEQKDREAIAWNKRLDILLKIISKVEKKEPLDYDDWSDLEIIKGVTSFGGHVRMYMDRMLLCQELSKFYTLNSQCKQITK